VHLIPANRVGVKATVSLDAAVPDLAGRALHANTTGHVYVFTPDGRGTDPGPVSFDQDQRGSVTLRGTIPAGTKIRIAVVFDDTPLMCDAATTRS
jgi:hypothetical protein